MEDRQGGREGKPTPSHFRGRLLIFCKHFFSILTPKFGNLPVSGKFCAIEVGCNFENLPISFFCLNPSYFLDVNVDISRKALGGCLLLFLPLAT